MSKLNAVTPFDDSTRRKAASPASRPVTRRHLFRIVGGAGALVTVVVVGGGAVRAVDQGVFATGDGPAYDAWSDWRGQTGDGPLNLLRAAVLASNAHNSQPWLFAVDATGIDLYSDPTRGTGTNDPLGRELVVSLGCALENIVIAAGPNGFATAVTLYPDPADPTYVARIELTPSQPVPSALHDAIPNRHTNRAGYKDDPIPAEDLAALTVLNVDADIGVVWLTSPKEMRAFADLTTLATELFIADTEQSVDSFAWWRGDWDELQERKAGITPDAAGLPALTRAFVKLMPDLSRAKSDEAWLKSTKDPQLSTAAAFGVLVARDHRSDAQRLQVGRLWQQMHLQATVEGMGMQPLNQTVERRDRELSLGIAPEIGSALDALRPEPGWQAMMPFRIGYPTNDPLKSPRRPAADVVIT